MSIMVSGISHQPVLVSSKQTVSDDPFGAKLKDVIRKRTSSENLQFYPNLVDESCPCGVRSYFNCVFKYLPVASYSENYT